MKQAATTSCCVKTPSMSSMGVQETTFAADAGVPASNIYEFQAIDEKLEYNFPKKSAVNIKFTDVYYKVREWTFNKRPGELIF